MIKGFKAISKAIKRADKIALFTHVSPDCDALGSSFALYYALIQQGKDVCFYSKDVLTVSEKIIFDESLIKRTSFKGGTYDLLIASDLPTLNRLGEYENEYKKHTNTILLDHHQKTEEFSTYNYINSQSSSCCEIVFELLKMMKVRITPQIASCLYAGLTSDTNSFTNSNTTQNSFDTAMQLTELGADIGRLNEIIYSTRTKKSIDFKKYLWNNYKIKGDCAYCLMPHKDLVALKGSKTDCAGYSHSLVTIQGVHYSFSIVEEVEGFFNISMRSKIGYDVRKIAEKIGGGGHTCASGASFYARNITEAKNIVLNAFKD